MIGGSRSSALLLILRHLTLILLVCVESHADFHSRQSVCNWEVTASQNPEVYWLNMASNVDRRQFMEKQLKAFGFKGHRIEAVTPNSTSFNIIKLQKPCKRNTDKDLAVVMSHLTAIHSAVYSTSTGTDNGKGELETKQKLLSDHRNVPRSLSGTAGGDGAGAEKERFNMNNYALILEDDVTFLFHINFTALIESAPSDFGILQLVTSNEEAIRSLWGNYKRSTAGLVLDVGSRTGSVSVSRTSVSDIHTHIHSAGDANQGVFPPAAANWSFFWTQNHWNTLTKDKKYPLFWSAQAYLINKKVVKPFIDDVIVFNPSNLTQKLGFKLINSFFPNRWAPVGLISSIHQEQVYVHKGAFEKIDQIVKRIRATAKATKTAATKTATTAVATTAVATGNTAATLSPPQLVSYSGNGSAVILTTTAITTTIANATVTNINHAPIRVGVGGYNIAAGSKRSITSASEDKNVSLFIPSYLINPHTCIPAAYLKSK